MSVDDRQYVYSQNNHLLKAVENGKVLGEYTYNDKGERIIKQTGPAATNSASDQTTVYHYDQAGRLIEETAGNGKLLTDYVYLDAAPLAMIRKQGNNEETFYYHNDHLGTSKVLTDKLGKVVWNGEFDPFGNEVQAKGRQGGAIRKVENNLRFPGQYFDAETGLHYNYNRYYDPGTGRYMTADPIGLDGGMNLFVYVKNNPINGIDPEGLSDITYNSNAGTLTITDGCGNIVGTYPAANNAQNGSRGLWQSGTYNYAYHTTHPDDVPNSAYGSNGNFVFEVPGCVGCGVHSGRANSTDRAGRSGPQYATNGCIRTTDAATSEIQRLIQGGDPLQTLTVVR